jgi:hypothetical protein
MRMFSLTLLIGLGLGCISAEAGVGRAIARGAARSAERSVARSAERAAARRAASIRTHDLWNHRYTKPVPLKAPRTVFRYTTPSQALRERRIGIAPGKHMTATGGPGRPLSPGSAQKRYGLPTPPGRRLKVVLPKGFPVRHNRVPGGQPGVGELTSNKRVPPRFVAKPRSR